MFLFSFFNSLDFLENGCLSLTIDESTQSIFDFSFFFINSPVLALRLRQAKNMDSLVPSPRYTTKNQKEVMGAEERELDGARLVYVWAV